MVVGMEGAFLSGAASTAGVPVDAQWRSAEGPGEQGCSPPLMYVPYACAREGGKRWPLSS